MTQIYLVEYSTSTYFACETRELAKAALNSQLFRQQQPTSDIDPEVEVWRNNAGCMARIIPIELWDLTSCDWMLGETK